MAPVFRWARSASRSDGERRLTTCAKRICSSVGRRAVRRRFQRVKPKKFPVFSIIPCVIAQECLSLHRNRELRLSDWALSSAGSERLPYKQRVGGSNPSAPTTIYYGIQIAAIHLLMSCCCFVLCSRWKGRGKSSALVGRWWAKGEKGRRRR